MIRNNGAVVVSSYVKGGQVASDFVSYHFIPSFSRAHSSKSNLPGIVIVFKPDVDHTAAKLNLRFKIQYILPIAVETTPYLNQHRK